MPEQIPLPGIAAEELPALADRSPCGNMHGTCDCEPADTRPVCPHCNSRFDAEDGLDIDGELHCVDCVHQCEECGHRTTDEDELYSARSHSYSPSRHRTMTLCGECCWECADCNERFADSADHPRNSDGERICYSCAESYCTCEECDTIIHNDNSHYDEAGERTLCQSCYENPEPEPESCDYIHNHDYKPDTRFFRESGELAPVQSGCPLFFGVELEVDKTRPGGTYTHTDAIENAGLHEHDQVYLKDDGSLNNGFEIVSHPCTWNYWRTSFDLQYLESLKRDGYRSYSTDTCGMHVHVSRAGLSKRDIFRLHRFFRDNKRLIERLSRRAPEKLNEWAALDLKDNRAIAVKVKCGRPAEDRGRYQAINLMPRGTVEFRLFRGTISRSGFMRNLALVVALCQFVKHNKSMIGSAFLKYLRDNGSTILGEPEATDLLQWIESSVNGTVTQELAA